MSKEESKETKGPLPVVPWLKGAGSNDPFLEGHKCGACGAIFLGERSTCSKCGARDKMGTTRLGTKGKLYAYSIVHRSFPGIDVPYISAIVDLDEGGTVKGNLINIDPDPEKLPFDLPVEVVFEDALGRKDKDGNSYISYFFQPAA
ncbi:MAG: Zn-ribbon domain-containing OB-fold protein [Pseudomonadales bacterium]